MSDFFVSSVVKIFPNFESKIKASFFIPLLLWVLSITAVLLCNILSDYTMVLMILSAISFLGAFVA